MKTYADYYHTVVVELDRVYEEGLSGLRTTARNKLHLGLMCTALHELTSIERRKSLYFIWWFGSAFIESLRDGGIPVSKHALDICNRFHDLIRAISSKRWLDRNAQTLLDFVKVLRGEVCRSSSAGTFTREVKRYLDCQKAWSASGPARVAPGAAETE